MRISVRIENYNDYKNEHRSIILDMKKDLMI